MNGPRSENAAPPNVLDAVNLGIPTESAKTNEELF